MEYVYAAMLLHSAEKDIDEDAVSAILGAAGVKADNGRVKALVASLDGVDIADAMATAVAAPLPLPPLPLLLPLRQKKRKRKRTLAQASTVLDHCSVERNIKRSGNCLVDPHHVGSAKAGARVMLQTSWANLP